MGILYYLEVRENMYLKLINSNVKKTLQDYQIYIITLVVSSALFFSFISLSSPCNTIIADGTKYSDAMFRQTINLTVGLVSLIFFVLVNYVNNHMIKRRAKEFSIYMLLGMEQKKIAFLYFVETLEVGLLAILIGTIAGTLLSGALTSIVILATGGDFDYKLGFYPDTFFKTMLFFIFVFILVGVFNTTKLSKTKLINLLNADKTVEGHLQNKKKYFISLIVTIISFASAVIMIKDYLSTGRGYMSNIPSVVSNKYQLIIGILLVCGIFSGYYAVSYIIYVVKERSKHYKYKKLNGVFISNLYARSASNAKVIASATIAIAVSILGFVVAPVLADISEEFLKFRMPYDLMINNSYRYIDKKSDIPHIDFSFVNRILNEHGIKESEICQQEGYFVLASNFENMETRDNKWDMPRLAVSLSDYNQMRKMAGLSPIELAEDEFALQASNEIDTESMKAKIEAADHEITLDNGQKIKLSENPIYNDAVGEYLYNFGNSTSFIFPDSICENLDIATTCYYVNTVETIPISICNKIEDEIKKEFRDEYTILYSKYETKYQSDKDYQDFIEPIRFVTQEKNAVKLNSVCMRLLGVYIGVIFFVICLTALSLQQLSDAENNKKQYGIMYKLGVEKSDIYKLIRKQISMFFAVPCFLAISGACVGIYVFMIRFGHKIVAYIGTKDFMLNIAIAIAMLLIIFNSETQEMIHNMPDIQLIYPEKDLVNSYMQQNRLTNMSYIQQTKNMLEAKNIGWGFNILSIFSVLLIGGYAVLREDISVGILFSMIVYVQQLYSPAVALGETYNSIKNAQPSILRISTLLENKEMVEEADFCPEGSLKGNIIFKNVTFSYAQNTDPVFRNLNLSLKAGRIYGITGDNGMGKSTFIRLIAGLCMPDSGNIYIDDIEIKKYNVEYLRKHIGYLLQKPLLLRGKNPIDNIDTKRMMRYFNMGKKRYLEENVKGLSGGESQKLALAYLLSDKTKDIYILDEPTASVDLKSEEVICSQIRDALKGKTALIITHRRSILKICDEVIDFNKEVSYKNVRKM